MQEKKTLNLRSNYRRGFWISKAMGTLTNASSGNAWQNTCVQAYDPCVCFYAPESNLERKELETLKRPGCRSMGPMYSFTDRELAEELVRLARSGVRVRVHRDSLEYREETQRGVSTMDTLIAGDVAVRVKLTRIRRPQHPG